MHYLSAIFITTLYWIVVVILAAFAIPGLALAIYNLRYGIKTHWKPKHIVGTIIASIVFVVFTVCIVALTIAYLGQMAEASRNDNSVAISLMTIGL